MDCDGQVCSSAGNAHILPITPQPCSCATHVLHLRIFLRIFIHLRTDMGGMFGQVGVGWNMVVCVCSHICAVLSVSHIHAVVIVWGVIADLS